MLQNAPDAQNDAVDLIPRQPAPDSFLGNEVLDDCQSVAIEFPNFGSSGVLREENLEGDHCEFLAQLA